MLKPTSKKITNYFMYYGWTIIVMGLVFFAVFTLILSSINKIKDNQKFSIFFATYGLTEKRYKEELKEHLKEDGVLEVNYYSFYLTDSNIGNLFDSYGYSAEISIVSGTDVKDMELGITKTYLPLTDELLNDIGVNEKYEIYTYKNVNYAIKIHDKNNEEYNNNFSYDEWIKFKNEKGDTDDFYLLLSLHSNNFGEYSKNNRGDSGIKGVKYFIDENTK